MKENEKSIKQLVDELEPIKRFEFPIPSERMFYVNNPSYKYILDYLKEERHVFYSYLQLDMEDNDKFCYEFVRYTVDQKESLRKGNLQEFEVLEHLRADQKQWCDAYFEVDTDNIVPADELF